MSQEYWNNYAPTEALRNCENPEDYIYYLLVSQTLTSFLSSVDSVLDVGGGPGRFSLDIAPHVKTVEHIDFSQKMLDLAVKKARKLVIKNINFKKVDAKDLSQYSDQQFDKVISINTPISFSGHDWKLALTEMCRVASKAVLFTVSNFISAFPRLLEVSLEKDIGWDTLATELFNNHLFDRERGKTVGIDFPSVQSFLPGEIEREFWDLGFQVRDVRGLAILCRMMNPEHLKTIISDKKRLSSFLEYESILATAYGKWAPSREIMFIAERKVIGSDLSPKNWTSKDLVWHG